MKTITKVILLLFLTIPFAQANSVSSSIKRMYIKQDGSVAISLVKELDVTCKAKSRNGSMDYVTLHKNHPAYREIYAALLVSFETHKKINLRLSGENTPCSIIYMVLDR